MSEQGHLIFVNELARFAARATDPRLTPISARLTAPLRIAVHGRPGVGCRTVARALTANGVEVAADEADIAVHVIAETLKPEDRDAIAGTRLPVLVVLNKADLSGFGPGGPVAVAWRHCEVLSALTGRPALPLVAVLAVASVDETALGALRVLVDRPADLRSPDDFVSGEHELAAQRRVRLLESLDLFGIAHAVVALRDVPSDEGSAVSAVLRRVSGIDDVTAGIAALGREVRYRRILDAAADLEALVAISDDARAHCISSFLAADETVIARMAAAVDAVEASGLRVDPTDGREAHLRRARDWRRYSQGPVGALHRACGADIARGSLRLLGPGPR